MGKSIKNFFTRKRIILFSTIAVLLIAVIVISVVNGRSYEYDFAKAYGFYKEIASEGPAVSEITVTTDDMTLSGSAKKIQDGDYGEAVSLGVGDSVSFNVVAPEGGTYNVWLEYRITGSENGEQAISVSVNGETSESTGSLPLEKRWRNENDEFATDSLGNDSLPMQVFVDGYYNVLLNDSKFSNSYGLSFALNAGDNSFGLQLLAGQINLKKVTVTPASVLPSYADYDLANPTEKATGEEISLEAEKPLYKTDITVLAESSKDINVTPYNTYKSKLNTIVSSEAGQRVRYEFEVAAAGRYTISLNYAVTDANTTAFRTVYIDGKVPFGELQHYPLPYSDDYTFVTLGTDKPFEIYLTAGKHTIDIEVDGAQMYAITAPLEEVSASLSSLYLDLRKLVGPNPDKDREWIVFDYFPEIVNDMNGYVDVINRQKQLLMEFNGNDVKNQAAVYLDAALRSLNKLLEKPNEIPNNIALISEGTSSVVQSISSAVMEVDSGTMNLDRIFITPSGSETKFKVRSGFTKFWESVKFFFYTFGDNYSTETSDEVIEIWANRALQNVNLIQRMADSDFTEKTGIKVRVSMLKDEGKLVLANASGINPDGVIGISNWIPYELGLRDLIYEMNDLDGLTDIMSLIEPGAMLPVVVDGEVLALPETQDATVLFYRKDILDKLGLDVPDTWEDVKKMLPVLQRNGMNFYLPVSSTSASKSIAMTAPFIYQCGGSLYGEDGMSTAIDSEASIEGFKLLTDLYTIYGLPQQVSNFAESFRDGSIPIGLGSMSLYSQLQVSAPELVGLWDISLSPGVEQEDGTVVRWQGGGATSCAIMKKSDQPEKVWEFIKWWMSTEVQTSYAQQCRAIWGNQFVWASANTEAFAASPFDDKQKTVVLEQWKWILEVPRIPGWYMIERELSNAWSYVVIDGMNVRAAIDNAATLSDKEINRKLTEFGYIKNGTVVKQYKITTREDIINWTGK